MTAPISFTTYTTDEVTDLVQLAREIPRLIELHAAMQRMCDDNFEIMPDDAHDRIADAAREVTQAIIAAPISCAADIADKFRFAANLIDQSEHCMLCIEPHVVIGALSDLISTRDQYWNEVRPGCRNPAYESITFPEPPAALRGRKPASPLPQGRSAFGIENAAEDDAFRP